MDAAAIKRRVDSARLQRRCRGVYSLGPLSRAGELLAVVLAAGDGALLSHWTAAELQGLIRWRASLIEVLVPSKRVAPPGAKTHRATIHWRDRSDRDGIPVTSIPRLLVDLSDSVRVPDQLTALIREADYQGRHSLLATRDAIERANGRRNLRLLEQALQLYEAGSAGVRSRGETDALVRILEQGLPRPLVNTRLLGEEVDFHWPDLGLVVELDGPGHGRAPNRRADARRDTLLRGAGYEVVRVPEPAGVADIARLRTG